MRILLPPSETKLKGGAPHSGRFTLSFPSQDAGRLDLLVPLEILSRDNPELAVKVLGLGPKSAAEVANNLFTDAPVMPAIDRYTGVLYSATEKDSWSEMQRAWAEQHVFIHSALFGVISSADEIPAYRLSHDTKVLDLPLASYWGSQVSAAIAEMAVGDWVLDARSEGYRSLAPIPDGVRSSHLEVVSANGGKALNHFNKIHKGGLVAALVRYMPVIDSPEAFVAWAAGVGIVARLDDDSVTLVV